MINTINTSKKGYIFTLDAVATLLIVGIIISYMFSQFPPRDVDQSMLFERNSGILVAIQHGEVQEVVQQGSVSGLVSFLDELDPECVGVYIRSSAGTELYNATKTGCTFPANQNVRSYGSFFDSNTLYVLEVISWT